MFKLLEVLGAIILLISLGGCFSSSCKTYVSFKSKAIPFEINNNRMIMQCKLSDVEKNLLIDFGAVDVLFDTSALNTISVNRSKSVQTPHGETKGVNVCIDSFESSGFSVAHWNPLFVSRASKPCTRDIRIDGLIGNSLPFLESKVVSLNFDIGEMTYSDEIETTGYNQIDAKFSLLGFITVPITIGGQLHLFVFDTGYNGAFLLSSAAHQSEDCRSYRGSIFRSLGSLDIDRHEFSICTTPYAFSDERYDKTAQLIKTNEIDKNLVGLEVIKRYNWIIDYDNNKLYYQPRRHDVEDGEPLANLRSHYFRVVKGSVVLSAAGIGHKYLANIGQKVSEIDGTPLTDLCDAYDKLKQNDFSSLKFSNADNQDSN